MGENLLQLSNHAICNVKRIEKLKLKNALCHYRQYMQLIYNLMNDTVDPLIFESPYFNEDENMNWLNNEKSLFNLAVLCANKSFINFIFDKYEKSYSVCQAGRKYMNSASGFWLVEGYLYIYALTLSALFHATKKIKYYNSLKKIEKRFEKLSFDCPENYLNNLMLLQAESRWGKSIDTEVVKLYDASIAEAHAQGFIQNEAIANECAAKFYLSRELKTAAQVYMQKARYCYQQWGALAKVRQLDEKYGELLGTRAVQQAGSDDRFLGTMRTASSSTSSSSTPGSSSFLDVNTVMKATQAISGEIEMKNLLSKMIRILAENAGAQKAVLVLEDEGRLFVESVFSAGSAEGFTRLALEQYGSAPEPIIRYTAKTQEILALDDTSANGSFVNDTYVKAHNVKSVLCLPVIKQKRLVGVLYLENNLAAGAFTRERIEMMSVLSAQAAINIENARLYGRLEEYSKNLEVKVAERTAELAEKNQAMLSELKLARKVQEKMLPGPDELGKVRGCQVAGKYLAMEELGGDIYDVIKISDTKYGFVIADVSGHGVSASLVTAMAKVSFNANALLNKTPAEVCGKVNSEICQLMGEKGEHDVTAFFGILDTQEGAFEYTCCAHQPGLWLKEKGGFEELTTEDTYMGLVADVKFTSKKIKLATGDRVVLYTDGIVEAMNQNGEQFDTRRLVSAVMANARNSAAVFVQRVIDDVDIFCGHAKPHDDRAILCVDYTG
ncbi:MAG: GAF domain-containing protein [Spirochaetaceae bacterium]|nr:MAG: GAF domain-containing protein [Spirochaetaceae bacterium]